MIKHLFLPFCLLFPLASKAQNTPRALPAQFIEARPTLDGLLTDSCWLFAPPLDEFLTAAPVFGQSPRSRTEARIFYGTDAIYVAAYCHTGKKLRADKNVRDAEQTGDWLQVSFDTWADGRMAFDFTVTAAGAQSDSRQGSTGWDGAWNSAVKRHADGWSAELRIPYTALRFPKKEVQDWGLQIARFDRATGETSTWHPQNPLIGDRVLQFGRWTDLNGLSQERRFSFAAQGQVKQDEDLINTFPNEEGYSIRSAGFGLDGRIGLSQSATLDFTVLPQRTYVGLPDLDYPGSLDQSWQSGFDVYPRQFLEEEGDLFQRSTTQAFTTYPPIYAWNLAWRARDNGSGITILGANQASKLLQATKLTARNKKNFRIGIYNALLGPTRREIVDINSFQFELQTLQRLSNYNYLSAEYILPNNGFVHFSNGMLNAGKGYIDLSPAVNFSVRDRTNQYAFSGSGQWGFKQRNGAESSLGTFAWQIARINRRWGWSLSQQENAVRGRLPSGPIIFGNIVQGFLGDPTPNRTRSLMAEVNYRDFRHKRFMQNQFAYLGARLDETLDPPQRFTGPRYVLVGGYRILDKKFQNWYLNTVSRPYQRIVRYGTSSYIDRLLSPEWDLSIGYVSDLRRRIIFDAALHANNTEGDRSLGSGGGMGVSWVPLPALSLRAGLRTSLVNDALQYLPAPGRWIFEQRDARSNQTEFAVTFTPSTRLRAWFSAATFRPRLFDRKTVELLPSGELVSVEWPLNSLPPSRQGQYEVGLQWFVSRISQLRASYSYFSNSVTYAPSGNTFQSKETRFDLSFIFFLNGNR
jgi:hypothetical protein